MVPIQASATTEVPVLYQFVLIIPCGSHRHSVVHCPPAWVSKSATSPAPKSMSWVMRNSAPAMVSKPMNLGKYRYSSSTPWATILTPDA